eukprot:TRINITY_DN5187_c0_g1_i1.p1 TRINITY_DN5187_c0_g1~~TRINITY_DN5187_c0_g1_i1.p1  ORF type:complete len:442 (-),score=32.75 TRINITY_DN5187_c0_g1_i1:57-1382(-)
MSVDPHRLLPPPSRFAMIESPPPFGSFEPCSQPPPQRLRPEVLVFQGGGTKGVFYAGAIRHLESQGFLRGILSFAGTSAGAQMAALLAFGYTGEECEKLFYDGSLFRGILDGTSCPYTSLGCCCGCGIGVCRGLYRLRKYHGYYLGDFVEEYLDCRFAEKRVNGERGCTFEQLYDEKGVELRVGVCDIVSRGFEYFDRHNSPALKVSTAVRASSAVPLVFPPQHIGNGVYIDGGIQGNLPIGAFPGKRVLAFHLSCQEDRGKPKTLSGFVTAIFDMMFNSAQRKYGVNFDTFVMNERPCTCSGRPSIAPGLMTDLLDILTIDCGTHGMMETNMSTDDVRRMIAAGKSAAEKYLREFDSSGGDWDPMALLSRRSGFSLAVGSRIGDIQTENVESALQVLEDSLSESTLAKGEKRDSVEAALNTLSTALLKRRARSSFGSQDN